MSILLLIGLLGIANISNGEVRGVSETDLHNRHAIEEYAGSSLLNIPLLWKPTDTITALDAIDLTGNAYTITGGLTYRAGQGRSFHSICNCKHRMLCE